MAQILVDTSSVYALLDKDDEHHRKAASLLRSLPARGLKPLLTNFVVAECHALLLSRLSHATARRWLLNQVWPVERVTADDESRAREIIGQFRDKAFSYTDASCFAVMERLKIAVAFGFDPHFEQYGMELLK